MDVKYRFLRYLDSLIDLPVKYKVSLVVLVTFFTVILEKWIYLWADVSFIYTIPMVVLIFFFPTILHTGFSFILFSAMRLYVHVGHISIVTWLIFVTHALIAFVHFCLFRLSFYFLEQKNQYKQMFFDFVTSLAQTIDMKDHYTAHHSVGVAIYARRLGAELGFSPKILDDLYIGGLLHDIGKIGVPGKILNKNSALTDSEFSMIKKHPELGLAILELNRSLGPAIKDIIHYHHERWDGLGYPSGLAHENIPLLARIVCIADSFDAITTNRSYQKRRNMDEALTELKRCKGTQFDPKLVDSFVSMMIKDEQEISYEIQTVQQYRSVPYLEKSLA